MQVVERFAFQLLFGVLIWSQSCYANTSYPVFFLWTNLSFAHIHQFGKRGHEWVDANALVESTNEKSIQSRLVWLLSGLQYELELSRTQHAWRWRRSSKLFKSTQKWLRSCDGKCILIHARIGGVSESLNRWRLILLWDWLNKLWVPEELCGWFLTVLSLASCYLSLR